MTPSEHIDREIKRHPDWRGQIMADVRRVIRETVPDVTEEWKWMGTPTWSHHGILCICNAFKSFVKVTFISGAQLGPIAGLFNAELDGNKWRAIKHFEGDKVNENGLKKALLAAAALNASKGKGKATSAKTGGARTEKPAAKAKRPAARGAKPKR